MCFAEAGSFRPVTFRVVVSLPNNADNAAPSIGPALASSDTVRASELRELFAFVREFGNAVSDPADLVQQSVCATCAGTAFWMQCSEEDGVALRICGGCKHTAFIGDSEEHWEDADTGDAQCPCGKKSFNLAVGYCLDAAGEVTWMIVGAQCLACAEIGVYTDWSIDYEPTKALLTQY
jgi:hypothetical protein